MSDQSTQRLAAPSKTSLADGVRLSRTHCVADSAMSDITPTQLQLQTKLTVNTPGDKYEQEADRVADQVMRMSAGTGDSVESAQIPNEFVQRSAAPSSAAPSANADSHDSTFKPSTFDYIRNNRDAINNSSQMYNVPVGAVAGAIANEHDRLGVVDRIQDKVIPALSESDIQTDYRVWGLSGRGNRLLNSFRHDLGPANVNLETASLMVKEGRLKIPGTSADDLRFSPIVNFLETDEGTAQAAAAVIQKGMDFYEKIAPGSLGRLSQETREAVLVDYFKQGEAKVRDNFLANEQRSKGHLPAPGDDGNQYLRLRTRLLGILKPNSSESTTNQAKTTPTVVPKDETPIQIQKMPAIGYSGAGHEQEPSAGGDVQRVANSALGPIAAPSVVNQVLSSPGSSLPHGTRSFMESRFGRDFSQVRIHDDALANKSAQAVSARAYTVGNHIVFNQNEFHENTSSSRHLLAHELTHTLQQGKDSLAGYSGSSLMRQQNDAEPAHTPPRRINIPIGPKSSIEFHTQTSNVGVFSVYVTGQLAIAGNASLIGEELPKKNPGEGLQNRVRQLLSESLSSSTPTASGLDILISLAGESLQLKLKTGSEKSPAFQVSGHFQANGRNLSTSGCEVTGTTLTLNATAWIAPSSLTQIQVPIQTDVPIIADDASVEQFSFAGDVARFSDKTGKGPNRSGGITLKSAMDAFEAKVPDFVKNQSILRLPEQRAAFFQSMRGYFGTDEKTVEHFSKMRKASLKGATTWLHDEAASRVEKVQEEIGIENMPASGGVGWPRSESTLASKQSLGNLHNIGFAVDYNAYQAPHIKDQKILDLIKVVSNRSPTAKYGSPEGLTTRNVGEKFTRGTEDEQKALAADPRIQKWMERVEQEAAAVSKASEDFRGSLRTKQDGVEVDLAPQLLELRTTWFAAKTPDEKQKVLTAIPSVTKPWLDKIAAQRIPLESEIAAAGLDSASLPKGDALKTTIDELVKLQREFKSIPNKPDMQITATLRTQIEKAVAKARSLLKNVPDMPGDDVIADLHWWSGFVEARRVGLVAKSRLDQVKALYTAVSSDPPFVFGTSKQMVVDPGLAQLVDTGFFTLSGQPKANKEAFNIDFIKSMVKHGFNHGAGWDTPDLMHFELRWDGPA